MKHVWKGHGADSEIWNVSARQAVLNRWTATDKRSFIHSMMILILLVSPIRPQSSILLLFAAKLSAETSLGCMHPSVSRGGTYCMSIAWGLVVWRRRRHAGAPINVSSTKSDATRRDATYCRQGDFLRRRWHPTISPSRCDSRSCNRRSRLWLETFTSCVSTVFFGTVYCVVIETVIILRFLTFSVQTSYREQQLFKV